MTNNCVIDTKRAVFCQAGPQYGRLTSAHVEMSFTVAVATRARGRLSEAGMETKMDAYRRLPVLAPGNRGRWDHVEFPITAAVRVPSLDSLIPT